MEKGGGTIGKVELLGGKYRLLSVAGKGATATVYLAEEISTGRQWAIKEVTGEEEKLRREAALLQKLRHSGIPAIKELFFTEEKGYLVMEYIDGKTIGQRMREGKLFSEKEILKTGIKISQILCFFQKQKPPVFYRDLKPDNVMISETGDIYLVDFGSAGPEQAGAEVRYGTRGYAAPEQYEGKCDARSDIYSLGALLESMADHAEKQQKKDLFRVIAKCSREEPEKRYPSGKKVKRALKYLKRKKRCRKMVSLAFIIFLLAKAAVWTNPGKFPMTLQKDAWEEKGDLWFCGNPVEKDRLPNYQKALEAFKKAEKLSRTGDVECRLVNYYLADESTRNEMQLESLLTEFLATVREEPEREKRYRRYLAIAGMYFGFSEELNRECGINGLQKGIEVLEEIAEEEKAEEKKENESKEEKRKEKEQDPWKRMIWQKLADACYLGEKSGNGEQEQRWCRESLSYYERLLFLKENTEERKQKNLLRAAELALQLGMREKAERYLDQALEFSEMREDAFYQKIRKQWEDAR